MVAVRGRTSSEDRLGPILIESLLIEDGEMSTCISTGGCPMESMIELSCFSQPPCERRTKRPQQINRENFAEVYKETVLFLDCWKQRVVGKLERRWN
jgi:hypothetical protein